MSNSKQLFFGLIIAFIPIFLFSQINSDFLPDVTKERAVEEGQFYSITILTAAPGEGLTELYLWWGHCAIIVEDLRSGEKITYDYGIFSMPENQVLLNFMGGRIDYIVASRPGFYYNFVLNSFMRENRWVVLQRLDLEPDAVYTVVKYLENNVKPANRVYKYHFFKENCCTKVRDIVDVAIGGQLFDETAVDMDATFRSLAQQYLAESFLADWGLMFLLSGDGVDQPITKWDSFYLPYELMNELQNFKYMDSTGKLRSIVKDRIELLPPSKRNELGSAGLSNGDPSRIITAKPKTWLLGLFFGLISGAIASLLFLFGTKSRAVRIIGGIYTAVLALFLLAISTVLFYMAFFSSHDVTYNNINLILVNPFTMLIGFILSIFYAANIGKSQLVYTWFWFVLALGGVIELFLGIFNIYLQDNIMILSALLPLFLLMSISGIFRNRIGSSRSDSL